MVSGSKERRSSSKQKKPLAQPGGKSTRADRVQSDDPVVSEEERRVSAELRKLVRPLPKARYEVDHHLAYLEVGLKGYVENYQLNLEPDFQRGHVWTQEQQESYVESVLRGAVTTANLLIQFNCPFFDRKATGDLPREMQCVDGLQRLTAVRRFMAGEIKAFGRTASEFRGTEFDPRRYMLRFAVHAFQTRAELLQYYLDINVGGTPHSAGEIARVRALLDAALQNASE